ncbi:MAG: pro-sigmaK processing inhibitor BofA family protein [Oscillospiraceae bacterium]|nr:pro-sigmaK processing inhibitor BofA family protein [Oscillospiraceae bacterium]
MSCFESAVLIIVGLCLLGLFFKIIKIPLRLAFKLAVNTVSGFVTLFILNFIGGFVGLSLALTPINAVVAGVFGLPGIVLLLILKYFF